MENTWDEPSLLDVVADVASRSVRAGARALDAWPHGSASTPSERVTARGVVVVVTALQQEAGRIAHLVTLAATSRDVVALESAAHLVKTTFALNAKVIVESAHVTLLFTLARDELLDFHERVSRFASRASSALPRPARKRD